MRQTTTLNDLRNNGMHDFGFKKLRKHVGFDYAMDEEIDLLTVLEFNGIEDMLWALRAMKSRRDSVPIALQLTIEFTKLLLPIFEGNRKNVDVIRRSIEAAQDALSCKSPSSSTLSFYQSQTYNICSANKNDVVLMIAHAAYVTVCAALQYVNGLLTGADASDAAQSTYAMVFRVNDLAGAYDPEPCLDIIRRVLR
jgi:hypothetical protein